MRVVIHLENPEKHKNEIYRFPYELFKGGGNIHITDTVMITQIAELVNGNVLVEYDDGDKEYIEKASIVTIQYDLFDN